MHVNIDAEIPAPTRDAVEVATLAAAGGGVGAAVAALGPYVAIGVIGGGTGIGAGVMAPFVAVGVIGGVAVWGVSKVGRGYAKKVKEANRAKKQQNTDGE